jgi:hypothetical protein
MPPEDIPDCDRTSGCCVDRSHVDAGVTTGIYRSIV